MRRLVTPAASLLGPLALVVACASPGPARGDGTPGWRPIGAGALRVESGHLGAGQGLALRVVEPELRAVARSGSGEAAELAFRYLGPTAREIALGNGEKRRQVGLKLRAQDTCNLVYVMWRIEPTPGIYVSVKYNPGQATHEECLDRGYLNLRPATSQPPPPVAAGALHALRASIAPAADGSDELRVHADGALVWQGPLPPEAKKVAGPPGVRADNARLDLELRTP